MSDQKPGIKIKGFNTTTTVEEFFPSSSAIYKDSPNSGTILTGIIDEGQCVRLAKGEEIDILLPNGKTIKDSIARIEVERKEVLLAMPGTSVGICLKKTPVRELRQILAT